MWPMCSCYQTSHPMTKPISQDGVSRTISEASPTHYAVKVQLFSLLAKNSVEIYESGYFEAGGYKWKLVIHPNGNKKKNVKEHMSLYLSMAETSSLLPGWEVHAVFKLFMLDQNKDNYLILQDATGKEKRFHGLKSEWGFDNFIPLKVFNDPSNGYLVDDISVFGAEVYVCKERSSRNGELLSMTKDAAAYKHIWRIENFSKLMNSSSQQCIDSSMFTVGNHKWKMWLYPGGKDGGKGSHISLYLGLAEIGDGCKIYATYTLRIIDQLYASNYYGKDSRWFDASNESYGWERFGSMSSLSGSSAGYVVKDVCLVEAEVTVLGVVKPL